jgi:hypothetical protein
MAFIYTPKQGWLKQPEIIPLEPDPGNTGEGSMVRVLPLWGRFLLETAFFMATR